MITLEEIERRQTALKNSSYENFADMDKIIAESNRVADVAANAPQILNDLEEQFSACTKLRGKDIAFLFLATALQCCRQYLLSNEKFRISAKEGDKLVSSTLKNLHVKKDKIAILTSSVPYDATTRAGDFLENDIYTGLSGKTHRYRTLGHDPVLGWIFGTANIITDSLTKFNFVETYRVENMQLYGMYPGSTFGMFSDFYNISSNDLSLLATALARQAMHFSSDVFTKQGLPVPIIPTISDDFSKYLTAQINIDTYSIIRGESLAVFINTLISIMHKLFYNESKDGDKKLYEVRTRKILSYSNLIATTSNVLLVALGTAIGVATDNPKLIAKSLQKLDIGGFLITMHRLITDARFIQEIKQEFVFGEFDKLIQGDM